MIYREAGQFKTGYAADQAIFPIAQDRWVIIGVVAFAFLVIPFISSEYFLQAIMIPVLAFSLAAIGLNILTGYCGQLSLGTGGFMAVGAISCYKLTTAFPELNILAVFCPVGARHRRSGAAVRHSEPADSRVSTWQSRRWRPSSS